MRVLVTGAGGFVGSHLTRALVQSGHRVRGLYRSPLQGADGVELCLGDIRDPACLRDSLVDIDLVVHLAAHSGEAGPASDIVETNVSGTLNLLHASVAQDCRVIHVSCHEVYGRPLYTPLDEKHPLLGQSRLAASRLATDMLAESFRRSFGLDITVLRLFPLFGPGQRRQNWLVSLIESLGNASLPADWQDLSIDALSISNAVAALVRLVDTPAPGAVFNLGSGQPWTLRELVPLLNTWLAATPEAPACLASIDISDWQGQCQRIADSSRLMQHLAWCPEPHREATLAATLAWLSTARKVA